jgi:RND family efflux transporter MFP subunit
MLPPEKGSAIAAETQTGEQASPKPEIGTHPVPAVVAPPKAPPSARSKPAIRLWLWAAAGLLAVGAGLAFYFQPWIAKTTSVVFETVALGPVTRVLAVNGRIAAAHSVDLRPQVSGTLADILVDEGDSVAQGADLARIDPSAQRAVARQAIAGLDSALVAQEQAQATYTRTKALGRNVPRNTLENAARAVQSAEQEVARMTALFDSAQIRLDDFTIRAPIAGTVLTLNVDPGQSVDPSTVLMTIADLSVLEVETDVDEAYATQIAQGQRAVLQLAGETTLREGRVSAVSQRVDAATGGLAVTLAFDAPVTAPVALTVTANIVVDSVGAAMTLPRAAVVTDALGTAVFVVIDGVAQRRRVQVIDWPAARLIVTSGVSPGDVVVADATGIVDGQAVSAVLP